MERQRRARIQIIASMIAFGTIGIFVKNIPLPSAEIALYRGAIAVVVLFLVMAVTGRLGKIKGYKDQLWKLFFSGAAIGANWILLFEAYRYTSVALSTLSYYFAPTLVVIASGTMLKERLSRRQMVCFIGSTAGLLLTMEVSGGGSSDFIGILCGLGAAAFYATVVMLNKVTGEIHIQGITMTGITNLLIVGILHTGIVYYLYFTSLASLSGIEAAVISYIDPVVAVMVSLFILRETVGPLKLLGGFAILLFAFLNEVKFKKK